MEQSLLDKIDKEDMDMLVGLGFTVIRATYSDSPLADAEAILENQILRGDFKMSIFAHIGLCLLEPSYTLGSIDR